MGSYCPLILADAATLDIETGKAEELFLKDTEVLVVELAHEELLCITRITGILTPVFDISHPAYEIFLGDMKGLTEVKCVQMTTLLIFYHHHVVGRLIVHQQLTFAVGDNTT